MLDLTTIILFAVAAASFLLLFVAFGYSNRRDSYESRIGTISAAGSMSIGTGTGTGTGTASGRVRAKKKNENRKTFRDRIIQAGLYRRRSLWTLRVIQLCLAAIPVGIGFAASAAGVITVKMAMFVGLIVGITGVIAPGFWLDFCKSRRQTAIRRSLPDALDVIVVCVEAGLSLNAALVRVSKDLGDAHPLLAGEMTIVHREVQMGQSTGEAMHRFAARFDLEELRGLAMVISQTEKFGASVVNALRVHSDTMRTKRAQQAQERAQKAAVKLLFPTVIFIFPALLVVILGPAVFDIIEIMENMTQ